ncbi:hypothetical protein JXJ21_10765 [candidate division KSB1 bacterium]|nr:hypothetical protein [candidate division KSB1 bacterium]
MFDIDLVIAIGLIVLIIIIFIISKLAALPKKSVLFLLGALAGVFGLSFLKKHQTNALKKKLEDREKELRERESRLEKLRKQQIASYEQLQPVKAELEKQRATYKRKLLENNASSKAEKEEIDQLSGEELHHKFLETFGG